MSQENVHSVNHSQGHRCKVIADYSASNPEPVHIHAGDELALDGREYRWQGRSDWVYIWCTNQQGKSGWVPASYIRQQGAKGLAYADYDATELTVQSGEILLSEKEESGWLWCTNQQGQSGWVPLANIEYQ